jgi:hypothetical protein
MLNTIANSFFEAHPDKVLGEFSISDYMNKIIVKGTREEVESYFKTHLGTITPKAETSGTTTVNTDIDEKPKDKPTEKVKPSKMAKQITPPAPDKKLKKIAPEVENSIIKVEGFRVLTIEETVKKYTPELTENDIKAFVWYNQTLGIPMTGWEKWFMTGSGEDVIKATKDVEYLNQQFQSIGKFQTGDIIGKITRFTHSYQAINYTVCRKVDGQLIIVPTDALSKSSAADRVSKETLKPLVKSGSLYYFNGDYVPLHVYSNTDYDILKSQLETDKELIIKEFGNEVYENAKSLIVSKQMRVDAPKFEDRFKLNPFGEIARNTKAGLLEADIINDDREYSVTEAFETWVRTLKKSDFHLVSQNEFVSIIIWERKERFGKDQDDAREQYKTVVANAQLECVRLFSEFCANVLDTETKTNLNRQINMTYNRSMLINTSRVPVGFRCSNKFKTGGFALKPVQVEAFKYAVSRNNWCLALTVGFGKTSVGISLLGYFISSGTLKKPLVVVPKPVLVNWLKEIQGYWEDPETKKAYFKEIKGTIFKYGILTGTGIEVINLKNLNKGLIKTANEVKNKKSCITICTYEALEKMYIGDEDTRRFVIEEWKTILSGTRTETARQWAAKMGSLEMSLNEVDKDAEVDIQALGFDSIVVDEAHRLKNMFVGVEADKTNRISSSFKGSSSNRALRGFYLSMYLQKINGRLGFLTATPFSNTPLEVYTMLCFLGYKELTKNNVNKISKFTELFFNETTEPKILKNNVIGYAAVMKNYKNKAILNTMLSNIFLYKDNPAEAGLVRPCPIRYPNNEFKLMLKMSPIQKLQRDLLVGDDQAAEEFANGLTDTDEKQYADQMLERYSSNVLSKKGKALGGMIVACSKISALSPFASSPVSVNFVTHEPWRELYTYSPKIRFTIDAIKNMMEYQQNRGETGSSFLIYMEVGVNILDVFKEALEHYCGFKRNIRLNEEDEDSDTFDEVELIDGTADSDKEANRRDKVGTLFNLGKVRVIIGTSTIKEGLNLQENCATLFILTPSWNSTDITQVEGRIHRQQNRYGYARVITPVVSRTLDSFIYQKYDEKRARLKDIWENDGKSDTDDMNVEISAERQKELILDDAKQIGKIRADLNARAKANIMNKAREDYEGIKNAIAKSGQFSELLACHLDRLSQMVKIVQDNKNVLEKLKKLATEKEEVPSGVKSLKQRIDDLISYYEDLLYTVNKANQSREAVDIVNIISGAYQRRSYYLTQAYDKSAETREFLLENGVKRVEFENLFEDDIFSKIGVYTKVQAWEDSFQTSLKRLKDLYGSFVMAERLLSAEGLSMTSNITELDAVVERYKTLYESIVSDVEQNFERDSREEDVLRPKQPYIEKLVSEAERELAEENKYAMRSEELGNIFADATNHQLTYLISDVDPNSCTIPSGPCCDTQGKKSEHTKPAFVEESPEKPEETPVVTEAAELSVEDYKSALAGAEVAHEFFKGKEKKDNEAYMDGLKVAIEMLEMELV